MADPYPRSSRAAAATPSSSWKTAAHQVLEFIQVGLKHPGPDPLHLFQGEGAGIQGDFRPHLLDAQAQIAEGIPIHTAWEPPSGHHKAVWGHQLGKMAHDLIQGPLLQGEAAAHQPGDILHPIDDQADVLPQVAGAEHHPKGDLIPRKSL